MTIPEQDLMSLRARVAELEDRLDFLYKRLGIQYSSGSSGVDPRILDAIQRGNKIEAIKIYREITNLGLAEAKAFIDQVEAGLR